MSTFYFSVGVISRGKGQSAVASASYRSGEKLYSVLDGETKQYGKRTVQPETFILAPQHAPEWVYDRQRLWNEVELFETHRNARLAREVKLALPIELPHDAQRKLLEEFVQENFVERGMVADVAIHRDVEHNPHAHVMLTVRPFNEDGTWGNKKKKEYVRDENGDFILDKKGKKKYKTIELTDWDRKETLIEWRKNFAEKVNEYYKMYEIDESVSHKSYEEQGLNKIPKHRLTREEYEIEKREREYAEKNGLEYKPKTYYGQLNYEIEKANKELEILTQKVVDLNEYRKVVKGELEDQLNAIRENANLSESDWEAIRVVVARTRGYVDLDVARENVKRLGYWKQKLDREKLEIIAFGKTLESAKLLYSRNPKEVLKLGFIPSKFNKEIQEKTAEYNALIENHNNKVHAYHEINRYSQRAYEIQQSFVDEEFAFLYPQYANSLEQNEKVSDLKFHYVDLFKKEGLLRHEIPEIEYHSNRYSNEFVKSETLVKDWKENMNSLMILERTRRKYQREYRDNFTAWDKEKVFDHSVKFMSVQEQIKSREERKELLASQIHEQLKVLYPYITDETLNQLPDLSKVKLLELHVNEQNTGDFTRDLLSIQKQVKEDIKADLEKLDRQYNNHQEQSSNAGEVGDIFSNILFQAQKDKSQHDDDLERQRQRAKRLNKKVTKAKLDLWEREL